MTIGEKISTRRKELGLTLEDVGNAVGVGKSTVKKWESGFIANMRRDKIAALAKILQLCPTEFVSSEEFDASQDNMMLSLKKDETILLNVYRTFNDEGKEKILGYAKDLESTGNYKKDNKSGVVQKEA